jgi:hypothetical protein
MKKLLLVLFSITASTINVLCQKQISINNSCSYYGEKMPTLAYTFSSDNESEAALKLITDASGLSPNFTILAGNVPNACATMIYNEKTKELKRYIIYNQTFIYNVSKKINYWASISILAHEVGHHLNGHSLQLAGSRPSLELEADKFSGFILAKLGATLEDAQSAINSLVSEQVSSTHPPKSARLAAIANGWYENYSKINGTIKNVKKPTEIFAGDPSTREQVYIKKISSSSYKIISEKGYEFRSSEFKELPISEYLKIFWFPEYIAYGYIQDYNIIDEQKLFQLKMGNASVSIGKTYNVGNAVIIYFPNNQFSIIYEGNFIDNPTYVDNKEVYINGYGKIRTYYYQFLYGSKTIMIQMDPDKLESSVKNNTILVGMGNLVN